MANIGMVGSALDYGSLTGKTPKQLKDEMGAAEWNKYVGQASQVAPSPNAGAPKLPPSSAAAVAAAKSSGAPTSFGKPSFLESATVGSPVAKAAPAGIGASSPSTTWTPTFGKVTGDATVAQQIAALTAANSPLVDQARQRAIQRAAARGLQNTSLAGQAGEEAAIAAALPIAQQDAATFFQMIRDNQQYGNAAGQFNASMGLDLKKLAEQARQSDNAFALDTSKLSEAQRQFNLGNVLDWAKLAETGKQAEAKLALDEKLATLDAKTKSDLSKMEAQYKQQLQASSSASEMWKQYQAAVAQIMTDKEMDAGNKQAAMNLLAENFKQAMALIGAIGDLNLKEFLNFSTSTLPQTKPPPVPDSKTNLPPPAMSGSTEA